MPGNESTHALIQALNHRAHEHALAHLRECRTQPGHQEPVDTTDLLRTARQNRQMHPTTHKTLTRQESVVLRQIQTNALPTVHLARPFQRLLGTPKCLNCGDYPSIDHTLYMHTEPQTPPHYPFLPPLHGKGGLPTRRCGPVD